jgi:CBS domain-containing protein
MPAPGGVATMGATKEAETVKVAEIMTTDVLTVAPSASLKDAADLMLEHGIAGMPVVGANGDVLGVISETDILFKERLREIRKNGMFSRRTVEQDEHELKLSARTVGAAMTMPALTIGADRPVSEAATLMLERSVNRLPVVDGEERLVGLVTRSDLVRAFARSDEEILRELREQTLLNDLWLDPDGFEITVERGEVKIAGEVDTENDAQLLKRWAALVPGVVSVAADLRVVAD